MAPALAPIGQALVTVEEADSQYDSLSEDRFHSLSPLTLGRGVGMMVHVHAREFDDRDGPANRFVRDAGEQVMRLIRVDISLSNPRKSKLKSVRVQALADTGAITLCIPEHLRIQLDLQELERREVTVANGKKEVVPYVGPVEIACLGRSCYSGALVLGDRVLLGAVPMQDMDLVISPTKEQIIVNPESPNIPSAIVM